MPSGRPSRTAAAAARPPYSRPTATELVAGRSATPQRVARELAVLEVADRVRREQAVALEERPQEPRSAVARATTSDRGVPRRRPSSSRLASVADGRTSLREPTVAAPGLGRPHLLRARRASGRRSAARPPTARGWLRPPDATDGARSTPSLGDDARDQLGRRDVEGGIEGDRPFRRDRHAADLEDLVGGCAPRSWMAAPSGVAGSSVDTGAQT